MPDALYWGRTRVDASDARALEAALLDEKPSAIINAAAFTAVDLAESQQNLAWRLNAEAPAAAARAAVALDVPLVHISTDYVFDGRLHRPYIETDPVNPLNVYGLTKLAGELAIRTHCRNYWILRASWVFSEFGKNFVTAMIGMAATRNSIKVVADQFGRPTYAGDLAQAAQALLAGGAWPAIPPGIYHAASGPTTSWHGFARLIFEEAQQANLIRQMPIVQPITTAEYAAVAIRPLRAILEPSPAAMTLVATRFDYRAGLHATVIELASH